MHDYDTRPYFYPANGELSNAFDTDTDEKIVVSRTYSITGEISHPIPEVGGRIMTETIIEAPTGWECAYGCFTDTSTKYETTLDVAVYEKKVANFLIGWSWYTSTFLLPLTELDDAGGDEHYVKSGQTDTHPLNHYGTSDTIDKLQKIAEEYYKLSGKNLYINDISLPKGGLFDWKATWNPPHVSHRLGTNADIDQKGIPCGENKKLKEATEKVRGNQPYPVLQCEDEDGNFVPDGEFYHYEFD